MISFLQIQGPPRRTDHRARYNGWNFDDRWSEDVPEWNGSSYDMTQDSAGESYQRSLSDIPPENVDYTSMTLFWIVETWMMICQRLYMMLKRLKLVHVVDAFHQHPNPTI